MKRARVLPVICLLAVCMLTPALSLANGPPPPPPSVVITVTNAPGSAYGVDLFLPKDALSERYTACNASLLEQIGLSGDCELANETADGYVSYLAHFNNAILNGKPERDAKGALRVEMFGAADASRSYGFIIYTLPSLQIAVYDAAGNIISISRPFVVDIGDHKVFQDRIDYDAATGEVAVQRGISLGFIFAVVAYILLTLMAWLITIGTETLAGKCFRLPRLYIVAAVNAVSNLIFLIAIILLCVTSARPLPYWPCVIVGEIVAILAEYCVYARKYKDVGKRKLLLFTCAANLTSAGITYLLYAILSLF